MPRFALGLIEKSIFISPSQEEALESIAGWDDAYQGAAIDDTPSQPGNGENSQVSPEEAVETISRDVSSPRTVACDAALKEDSYNENFESDRSQSPSRTLSWSLAAAAAHGGCSKDPKSPTSVTAAADEIEKSLLKREVMSEVEVSDRLREPPEVAVTSALRVEVQVLHQDDHRAEQDAEERSGRREGFGLEKADCGTGVVKTTAAEVEARPPVSSIGVRVVGSSLVGDVPAFGSGSGSAFMSLRKKEQDSQPALPVENHIRFGFEGGTSVRSTNERLDQMAILVQANLQVLDNVVVEEDHFENSATSGNDYERRRFRGQHELNSLEKVRERGGRVETDPIPSTGLRDELETSAGVRRQDGPRVKVLSRKEKSNERSSSQTSSRTMIDASKVQSVHNPGAGVTPGDGSQHSSPSPLRPPRAVQEKLEKLRSQSGNKRAHSGTFDLIADRLRTRDFSSRSALEAIEIRSGERRAGEVTAADLLKTALDVGITLPPPFHKNYFSR